MWSDSVSEKQINKIQSSDVLILGVVSDLKCSFEEVSWDTQLYFGIVPVFS